DRARAGQGAARPLGQRRRDAPSAVGEILMPIEVVMIVIFAVMPVSIIGKILRHRQKMAELQNARPPAPNPADDKRLEAVEREKKLLEERVRNLESIVCSVDLELNARLNRLAQSQVAALGPGAAAAIAVRAPTVAMAVPTVITPGKVLVSRYHIERE